MKREAVLVAGIIFIPALLYMLAYGAMGSPLAWLVLVALGGGGLVGWRAVQADNEDMQRILGWAALGLLAVGMIAGWLF